MIWESKDLHSSPVRQSLHSLRNTALLSVWSCPTSNLLWHICVADRPPWWWNWVTAWHWMKRPWSRSQRPSARCLFLSGCVFLTRCLSQPRRYVLTLNCIIDLFVMIFRKSVKWTVHSVSHGVRRPAGEVREYGRQNWEAEPVGYSILPWHTILSQYIHVRC